MLDQATAVTIATRSGRLDLTGELNGQLVATQVVDLDTDLHDAVRPSHRRMSITRWDGDGEPLWHIEITTTTWAGDASVWVDSILTEYDVSDATMRDLVVGCALTADHEWAGLLHAQIRTIDPRDLPGPVAGGWEL